MDPNNTEGEFENLRNRMEYGTYWADEAYQLNGEQADYDNIMSLDEEARGDGYETLKGEQVE